jgi:HEAT repeat protein
LSSKACAVRATAALRLAELGDKAAITALRELSETPKDETEAATRNCGQDEAAEAIRQLKKRP